METLQLNDMQGFLFRGYGYLPEASYAFIQIKNGKSFSQWLSEHLLALVANATEKPENFVLHIAFTYKGIEALELFNKESLKTFTPEFQEGPLTSHRLRMLGDEFANAPEKWHWGQDKQAQDSLHVVFMLFAANQAILSEKTELLKKQAETYQCTWLKTLNTHLLPDMKEHFGFRDGVGQPVIEGYKHKSAPENTIKAGEFILGYINEYGQYPLSPKIPASQDPKNILPKVSGASSEKDFGKNGTYLVFRQLEQHVKSFWKTIVSNAENINFGPMAKNPEMVAAKIMGRWKDGSPIVKCPLKPDPSLFNDNSFGYNATDLDGLKCPIGSHIRRTNPRDVFRNGPKASTEFVNRHRIIRRSRTYGQPLSENLSYKEILASQVEDNDRGIFFIGINANISRQFEFIQQTWITDPKFQGLYKDPDPLMGNQNLIASGDKGEFTVQADPVREKLEGFDSYVFTRGSTYLFLPSLSSLRYIGLSSFS